MAVLILPLDCNRLQFRLASWRNWRHIRHSAQARMFGSKWKQCW